VETIEKGLSNLQNEVVVVKTTLGEHTETLRINFIDNERKHLLRE